MKKVLSILFAIFIGINVANAQECANECMQYCNENSNHLAICYNSCMISATEDKCVNVGDVETNIICEDYCNVDCQDEKLESGVLGQQCYNSCLPECKAGYKAEPMPEQPGEEEKPPIKDEEKEESKTYQKIQCGDVMLPYIAAQITSTIVTILKIATPILIIVLGSIDLLKSVIAQKEDEIKKGSQIFIRRLIIGACVFLVFAIVQLAINLVAQNNISWECVACFVNGKC